MAQYTQYTSYKRHYRQTANICRTLAGNEIADHPDVVRASPVSVAPTPSTSSTSYLASVDWAKTTVRPGDKYFSFGIWWVLY